VRDVFVHDLIVDNMPKMKPRVQPQILVKVVFVPISLAVNLYGQGNLVGATPLIYAPNIKGGIDSL